MYIFTDSREYNIAVNLDILNCFLREHKPHRIIYRLNTYVLCISCLGIQPNCLIQGQVQVW